MTVIKYASLKPARGAPKASPSSKKVRDRDGKLMVVYEIDADSPTFSDDLSHVFRLNVKKARSENKKLPNATPRVARKK